MKTLVHLDLKGCTYKVDYFKQLMKTFSDWGATGVLIEWEDMLPWSGRLECLRAPNAYTREQIADILQAAKNNHIDVIPLMQTFGHLEFALKHPAFAHLREMPDSEKDICPLHPESLALALELVEQTIELHPGINAIHLGADEVWSLGSCAKCKPFAEAQGKPALFLKQIDPILDAVRSKGLRSLIWDDMLRKWPVDALATIRDTAELVVWRYGSDIETGLPSGMWDRYSDAGLTLWGASAFKGADGGDALWPNSGERTANHIAWTARAKQTPLTGIILTGWSRYNHYTCLCETMAAGMPTLAVALNIINAGGYTRALYDETMAAIGLANVAPSLSIREIAALPEGRFPGASALQWIGKLQAARQEAIGIAYSLPQFNGGRVSETAVRQASETSRKLNEKFDALESSATDCLGDCLFDADIKEIIESKIRFQLEILACAMKKG